ncbi:MAG: hypothetical protein HZA19_02145 [Nitrospirae bacterium]|nr:hypothetical protein [Nitrospirota bacterium]
MKRLGILMVMLFMQVSFIHTASAGDFDWLNNLNIQAEADSSGYQISLATRFHIGDAEVTAVIGNVDRLSDAYMIFRLGELSHRPVGEVIKVYRANGKKGWGVIAQSLGIKPGSGEFHALKQGHDLNDGRAGKVGQPSGKGKGKH